MLLRRVIECIKQLNWTAGTSTGGLVSMDIIIIICERMCGIIKTFKVVNASINIYCLMYGVSTFLNAFIYLINKYLGD